VSAIPVSTLENIIWDSILDTDSANRAFEETTLLRMLNKNYCLIKGIVDDRPYDLTASVSGAVQGPGTLKTTLSVGYIRRILEVYPATSAAATAIGGKALKRCEPWEISLMQFEDTTAIDPAVEWATAYACWRAGTATAADVGKWNLAFWRLSDPGGASLNYLLRVLKEPTALTNADTPDLDDSGCHALADMTAAIGARLIGRSEEEIADIKARIPDAMQAVLGRVESELGLTKARPAEQAA